MAVYAVGDIQGCHAPLAKLLEEAGFDAGKDTLWCVGDLVNRGPESLKVLRFLQGLGDACVCVLGNHDLHLLGLAANGKRYPQDTLDQVLQAEDRDALIEWLRHRPLMHLDEELGWCMVHAGLHPGWSINEAQHLASAIEDELRGKHWRRFCQRLQDLDFPSQDPGEDTQARLLFATAVLTRARYCSADGVFNWKVRAGESDRKSDQPWYQHASAWKHDGLRVVFGHWAAKGLITDQPHVLGLDSGCVWGGSLTMVRLEARGQWSGMMQVTCPPCAQIQTP